MFTKNLISNQYTFAAYRHYPLFRRKYAGATISDAVALAMPVSTTSSLTQSGASAAVMPPPRVRKEFPETWIWDLLSDTGYALNIHGSYVDYKYI